MMQAAVEMTSSHQWISVQIAQMIAHSSVLVKIVTVPTAYIFPATNTIVKVSCVTISNVPNL